MEPQYRPQLGTGLPSLGCDQAGHTALREQRSLLSPAQSIGTETDWDAPWRQRYLLGAVGVWPGPLTLLSQGQVATWPEWVAGSDLLDFDLAPST